MDRLLSVAVMTWSWLFLRIVVSASSLSFLYNAVPYPFIRTKALETVEGMGVEMHLHPSAVFGQDDRYEPYLEPAQKDAHVSPRSVLLPPFGYGTQ